MVINRKIKKSVLFKMANSNKNNSNYTDNIINNINNILLRYKNLFTDDRNFNLKTLKFEPLVSFDERDFEKNRRINIEIEMEKFIIDLTRNHGDVERCGCKIQESVKTIELNDAEIHRALQNSNINWQTYYSVPTTAEKLGGGGEAMTAATAAGDNDKNRLTIIQGSNGTLSTFVNEREPLKKLEPK